MVWHVRKAPKKNLSMVWPSPVPLFQWASSFRYQSPASCWPQRVSIFSIGSFAKKIGKRIFHSSASRRSGQKYLSFSLGKLPYTQKHPSVFGCKSLCLVVKPPLLVCAFDPSEKYESQLGSLFPIYGKMFQTTNQISIPSLVWLLKSYFSSLFWLGEIINVHQKLVHLQL